MFPAETSPKNTALFGFGSSQLSSFLPLSLSVSRDVIGATVELPLWFRWEQFEKIGWEKAQNNTYKSAKVHLVTADSLCAPFLSLIAGSKAAGLWFTLGFGSDNKVGLGAARYPIMHCASVSKSASRKRVLQSKNCPVEAGNTIKAHVRVNGVQRRNARDLVRCSQETVEIKQAKISDSKVGRKKPLKKKPWPTQRMLLSNVRFAWTGGNPQS